MGINTNVLTLGSSLPANTTIQHSPDTVPDSQANAGTGSARAGSTAAAGADQSAGTTVERKNAGAPAQTRRASGSQIRGKARTPQAHTTAAAATGSQSGNAPQDAVAQSAGDFGSAMASALGRSATNGDSAPNTIATDTPTNAATPQPDQAAPADAVAWVAQALMPAAAPAPALADSTNPDAAGAASPAGVTSGSATTGNAAAAGLPPDLLAAAADGRTSSVLAAQLAAQNAAAAGRFPGIAASAFRARTITAPQKPAPTPATSDDEASASASTLQLSDLMTLAGTQKLISGLTDATPGDTDGAASSAAPDTHAATATGSMDAAQATAALQASTLIRPNTGLGGATLTIHAPVNSPAFADEVGARVTGLAQSGITQAQLQLNPADLGPVQVHITMQSGQASVWFGATHADTRAALEQSLPRLRELFAGAGMPLSDSGVFREPPQQQQAQSLPASGNSRSTLSDPQVAPTATQVSNIHLSLLDTYA